MKQKFEKGATKGVHFSNDTWDYLATFPENRSKALDKIIRDHMNPPTPEPLPEPIQEPVSETVIETVPKEEETTFLPMAVEQPAPTAQAAPDYRDLLIEELRKDKAFYQAKVESLMNHIMTLQGKMLEGRNV